MIWLSNRDYWYNIPGDKDNIAVSTRIRLARNLNNLPFPIKMNSNQRDYLNDIVKDSFNNIEINDQKLECIYLNSLTEIQRLSLMEQRLISKDFAYSKEKTMIITSKDRSISIMVNEEDHIRVQVLKTGVDFNSCFNIANEIDNKLSNCINYAFDQKLGYLTSCPTNLGTGLRASVMLHLPAIELLNLVKQVCEILPKLGLTVRGAFGEGTDAKGAMFQISNQITLGLKDNQIIENLDKIVNEIIGKETDLREKLLSNGEYMYDKIYRSYAILKHARILTIEEYNNLISNLRMGISEKIIEDITISRLNELNNRVGYYSICDYLGGDLNLEKSVVKRAEIVREYLKS